MEYLAKGRIKYSPTNNGKTVRRDGGTTTWWIIIETNPELGKYYRELYRLDSYNVRTLNRPTWDSHISIVSNEKPLNLFKWNKYQGKEIEFKYISVPKSNDTYVWLPVICEQAFNIREELGLKRTTFCPLHLTIGNTKIVT